MLEARDVHTCNPGCAYVCVNVRVRVRAYVYASVYVTKYSLHVKCIDVYTLRAFIHTYKFTRQIGSRQGVRTKLDELGRNIYICKHTCIHTYIHACIHTYRYA